MRIALAVVGLACCIIGSLAGCRGSSGACGNLLITALKSPDGIRTAVLFERDCGATTGFSTQLSVIPTAQQPKEGGNVFIADDNHGAAPTDAKGALPVQLRWTSATQLTVIYPATARVFKREPRVDGVTISYGPRALP